MYLKSLEVENFKSFRGEVTIPFGRGFTAITGPNGSGKSNCGDAIQFVLGPKSNQVIRAKNSADLIFNGGKNSKPARACTVTLVFANPVMASGRRRVPLEKDEIRMTRHIRLTASNNPVNSYLLDGEESSQKVFHRLLGAANARPDGYNIVLQGDVTSLAKMTAKERRKVLDNVAGVTSYDDEIRKATKQKEHVESYLERIGLLENEQKERLKTLAAEKKVAERARDVTDRIQSTNTLLLHSRYASIKNELAFHIDERQKYIQASNDLIDEHRDDEKRLLGLDDRIAELQREIDRLTGGETSELAQAIRALQVNLELNADRVLDAEKEAEDDAGQMVLLHEQRKETDEELKAHMDDVNQAKAMLAQARVLLDEAAAEEKDVRASLDSAGEQNQALSNALQAAETHLATANESVSHAQSAVDRLAIEAELQTQQLAEAQEAAEDLRLALGDLDVKEESLAADAPQHDRASLAQALANAQRTEAQLADDRQQVEAKLQNARRALASAQHEMEQRSGAKGLAGGASAVIAARDRGELNGVIGTIAELCAPKDDDHELALATAIGGGMASVVVESDEDAARAIRWLAEHKAGRATFLPLNRLNNTRAGGRAVMTAKKDGVLGFAHEMLDYDPRIDVAVRFVLRNTLVVKDMATARRHMGGVRLVTLRGDVTEAGGAMIGGSRRRQSIAFGGRIQGASEVEKQTGLVQQYQLMAETVAAALSEARRTQQQLRQQINALVDDSHAVAMRELQAERKQTKGLHRKATEAVSSVERRLEALHQEARVALDKLTEAQREVAASTSVMESAKSALEAASPQHLRDRMHEAHLKRVAAEGEAGKAEATLANGAGQESLLRRRLAEVQASLDHLERQKVARSERIDALQAQLASDRVSLKEKKAEQAVHLEENKGLELERQELADERTALRIKNEHRLEQAQQHRRLADELQRTVSEKELELHGMGQELMEAGLSLTSFPEQLGNVGELERTLRRLQRRLDEFGQVNMMAIEQYDACQARLDLMKDEFALLKQRRQDLIDITSQLEEQRKSRLLSVLEQVNENFKTAYKELSDGGRGELFLEHPDEPFKGGLELWAQPRGKSSKVNRQQLSGGEQSMAALALIFAIQDYDPSPFYYFDEVDQNLDAYNAERIAKMCRKRSQRAQFIMVTLRKVSLKLADHHIGITHGGDGCSRRIMDFDRDRAMALGEAALKEAENDANTNETRLLDAAAAAHDMPQVPDALGVPQSLGGLVPHLAPQGGLGGLVERTEDTNDDIEERAQVARKVAYLEDAEDASEIEQPTDDVGNV